MSENKVNKLLISLGSKPRTGKVKACLFCGKEFYAKPSQVERRKCCSKKCINLIRVKELSFECPICNKIFLRNPSSLVWGKTRTCSKKCSFILKSRLADERRKSGIYTKHQIDRQLRYNKRSADWRKSVFERDNYTCQECGKRGGLLEAHHIKPFAYFPESRYDLNNGKTLCLECHNKTKIPHTRLKEKWLTMIKQYQN